MTLGLTPVQPDLLKGTGFVADRVGPDSVWVLLHREGHRLFPDELFADLFTTTGRRSVPPSIVATVMVLQRLFGLSDREAVDAFEFDTRWKFACGGLDFDFPGFVHTVLVDMRARLARSDRPRRIFEVSLDAAREAGLVSFRRVLDSTPLYDAVATQDTVTMIRSAIRRLLMVTDPSVEAELRAVLVRDDDYRVAGKPVCDWDDRQARVQLVDDLARDGHTCLWLLEDRDLTTEMIEAVELLATVIGQDLEIGEDGRFRIARKVAKDRVISTVDPDARHGHKTAARGFDGYKGHVAADPDSELITNTIVTPGNTGDGAVAEQLIEDLLSNDSPTNDNPTNDNPTNESTSERKVYGDASYGTGDFQQCLENENIESGCRTQPPAAPGGLFAKDRFTIDLDNDTVTCPNQITVAIRRGSSGEGTAMFTSNCLTCPLHAQCTNATNGRTIRVGLHEAVLTRARLKQTDPEWKADYKATRPKIERKLGHLMRRRHGGRKARVRGQTKVDADFNLLAAAHNIARSAALKLTSTPAGWAVAT